MKARWLLALLGVMVLAAAGCGGKGSGATTRPTLVVSAAASLKGAFTQYGNAFNQAEAVFSFAGSDDLAAQIRQGAKPDLFAAANTKLPDALHKEHLVGKPTVFAANRLVIAVAANSTNIKSIDDLAKSGVKLAIGDSSVPIGAYTRNLLARLGRGRSAKILKNVRSNEPDVTGIVGKLTQGAVDAGFVYATDVKATDGKLKGIDLALNLQPRVDYAAAVVDGAAHPQQARTFIDGLSRGSGERALHDAGFEPPPSS